MLAYVIEDKIIDITNGEVRTYYFAKDDYVHSRANYCEGYKRKAHALIRIKKEIEDGYNFRKLDDNRALENEKWLHIYKVVEVYEF